MMLIFDSNTLKLFNVFDWFSFTRWRHFVLHIDKNEVGRSVRGDTAHVCQKNYSNKQIN